MILKDLWKKFDDFDLSHSAIHHLMAIHDLLQKNGYARGVDVARHLNITRGSAFTTLKNLREKNYISEDKNKFFFLTDSGRQVVEQTLQKRKIFKEFFYQVLGLEEQMAEEEACKIEHLLSIVTAEQTAKFISFIMTDAPEAVNFRSFLKKQFDTCQNSDSCDKCEADCLFRLR